MAGTASLGGPVLIDEEDLVSRSLQHGPEAFDLGWAMVPHVTATPVSQKHSRLLWPPKSLRKSIDKAGFGLLGQAVAIVSVSRFN